MNVAERYFAPRAQRRPLFGEGGYMTTIRDCDVDAFLQRACNLSSPKTEDSSSHISSPEFVHIARIIAILDRKGGRLDRERWGLRPRLYTLLRGISALAYMEEFVKNNIFDISLPYSPQTLPEFLADPGLRALFLAKQACVLTDARLLESRDDDHLNLIGSADEHLVPLQHLGSGGFGAVDLVFSRLSTRLYARKRVFRGRDNESTRREQQYLVEEIRVLKLLSHRHLTQIIQSYSDQDYIGYLMEPIAECNLHTYLIRKQISGPEIVHLRQFFGCLAGAVHYLHNKNIRHRDLKLENVLVKQSQVYVADFGTAMEWSASRRGTTQDRGVPVTEWYMSPEVDERGPRNVASDMWALGIVFLEMLTVVKGQTIRKWKDYLKKRAFKARVEPRPCRNTEIIKGWMELLQEYSPRLEDYDDDGMALRDNAPLSWITDLLVRQPDSRITAKRLVKTIAESGYLQDFACFACVHEFTDPRCLQGRSDYWAEDKLEHDREAIDAEVTAMVGMSDPTELHMEEERELTVMNWLEQSSKHWEDEGLDGRDTVAMPGPFEAVVENNALHSGTNALFETTVRDPALYIKDFGSIGSPSKDIQAGGLLHDGGFFVDQDDDSSADEETYRGIESRKSSNDLFPIVQDASSESSGDADDSAPADTPMTNDRSDGRLCQILEAAEEEDTVQELSSHGSKLSSVRFNKTVQYNAYCEDDTAEQAIQSQRKERASAYDGPCPPKTAESDENDFKYGMETIVPDPPMAPEEIPIDTALMKTLFKPTLSARSPHKTTAFKPTIKPRTPIQLPWHDDLKTLPRPSEALEQAQTYPSAIQGASPPSKKEVSNLPRTFLMGESFASSVASTPKAATATDNWKRSTKSKLSISNVERLNKQNSERARPEIRSLDDEGFAPAAYIEKAWQNAEAADSLATSVVSSATARKLSGLLLVWHDKSYRYLEYYCKIGKVGAVRLLLEQGCNCGTILKPRPGPLFNAITGTTARHNKCVRALIKAGCNVNTQLHGRTALHTAIGLPYFDGYQKLLAMLLAAGAEVNECSRSGEYPLLKLFGGATDEPLEEYQRESLALILHANVQSAVDVNVRQSVTKDTALHLAVRRRTAQAVALLVHRGADVNAKDASGTTPLLVAANQWRGALSAQQERTLAFLLSAEKIDVNVSGGTLRRTALHHAAAAGCTTAIERLMDRGADSKIVDKEGSNALAILQRGQTDKAEVREFQLIVNMLSKQHVGEAFSS